jgi:hypothetical protein
MHDVRAGGQMLLDDAAVRDLSRADERVSCAHQALETTLSEPRGPPRATERRWG